VSATAAAISREGVLMAGIMTGVAYVALSISRLVSVEVIEPLLPTSRQRSMVTVTGIKAVVDVAVKTMRAMKPRTGSEKYTADKPIGAIVAVRSAVIRSVIEVPIGADRSHSNANGDLGWRLGCTGYEGNGQNCERENFNAGHRFLLQ
jgi:hypothetical protein